MQKQVLKFFYAPYISLSIIGFSFLAGCSGSDSVSHQGVSYQKALKPYKVGGNWYHPYDDKRYNEVGIASWYGPGFDGNQTALGEIYDMDKMTAAHKTLPLPSYVEVTNLKNGKNVVLRVNDRGPFKNNRIIDLSRAAAKKLGIFSSGLGKVRVKRIKPPEGITILPAKKTNKHAHSSDSNLSKQQHYIVRVGSFANEGRVQQLKRNIAHLGQLEVDKILYKDSFLQRVALSGYRELYDAKKTVLALRDYGVHDAVIVSE